MATQPTVRNIITDKLVVEKTGKTMAHWFSLLDKKGARQLSHNGIFDLIVSIKALQPLGQWNQNLLATSYEWDRGIKERGQKGKDFEISVSRTIAVPVNVLYDHFTDADLRKRWLRNSIEIRKATENKSARITWSDNTTSLSVDFYTKGIKSQVVVQHQKISDSEMATRMKTFWGEKLDGLKSILE